MTNQPKRRGRPKKMETEVPQEVIQEVELPLIKQFIRKVNMLNMRTANDVYLLEDVDRYASEWAAKGYKIVNVFPLGSETGNWILLYILEKRE